LAVINDSGPVVYWTDQWKLSRASKSRQYNTL